MEEYSHYAKKKNKNWKEICTTFSAQNDEIFGYLLAKWDL